MKISRKNFQKIVMGLLKRAAADPISATSTQLRAGTSGALRIGRREKIFRAPLEACRCKSHLGYIPGNLMCPEASPPGAEALWRPLRFFELKPEDVTPEWMDLMVKRLLRELDRQLNQIEKSGVPADASERAANARTLASRERALERLTRLENERVSRRERKVAMSDDDARAEFQRRLDALAAGSQAAEGDQ
ncbi:MAG: hypothetical protein KGJ81_16105 [Alphaproteobacteria bacterium]|nr:hypothetical protein [Alphaproteobacteria bacterium]